MLCSASYAHPCTRTGCGAQAEDGMQVCHSCHKERLEDIPQNCGCISQPPAGCNSRGNCSFAMCKYGVKAPSSNAAKLSSLAFCKEIDAVVIAFRITDV